MPDGTSALRKAEKTKTTMQTTQTRRKQQQARALKRKSSQESLKNTFLLNPKPESYVKQQVNYSARVLHEVNQKIINIIVHIWKYAEEKEV